MKTRSNLRRQLQDAFDKVEFICRHGNFYSGLEATEVAHDAYTLACRHGCAIEMPKMGTAHDALRLAGMLLAWAEDKPGRPLTVPEVAGHLRVRPDKVLAWIRSGRLRGYNVAEKENGRPKYRINQADLEAFTQQRSVTQPAPKGRPAGRRLPQPKWKP
ncbi:MAG: helix-turn-helix domain-containing protein [Thermoguttaceae bacterium]